MGGAAEEGERWPFACDAGGFGGRGGVAPFSFSRAFFRRARVFGERLRARARFSSEESEEGEEESESLSRSGISEMGDGEARRLALERVIGAK